MTTHSPSPSITGTTFGCGIFRIFKHPGDANCVDNSYPITVEFTLNDPGIYDLNDPNVAYATYGADYLLKVGNTSVTVTSVNGVYKGSVVISAGQSYVDVTVVALDDNISDDNERIYLNIVDAYAVKGHPFEFSKKPTKDFLLIKDSGWWIQSVEWVENPNGNELLTDKWTGLSVYADSNTPNPANDNFRLVDVVVTVGGILPQGGGVVELEVIDPPNASVHGASVGDNWGDNDILYVADPLWPYTSGTTLKFYIHTKTKTVNAKVSQYAGDNYIIEATAQNGNPPQIPNQVVNSEILTVWRRLWVESAQMYIPSGMDASGKPQLYQNGDQLADAPILGSHVVSQFERACISAKPFASNTVLVPGVDLFEASPSNFSKLQSYRTSVNQNDYWTVFAVGAFSGEDDDERGFHFDNTILIYNAIIEEEANHNSLSVNLCKELMLLHELGHAFGRWDEKPPFTLYEGIMRSPIDLIDLINNGWTGFTNDGIYSDIVDIQKHGNPE